MRSVLLQSTIAISSLLRSPASSQISPTFFFLPKLVPVDKIFPYASREMMMSPACSAQTRNALRADQSLNLSLSVEAAVHQLGKTCLHMLSI